MTITNTKVRTQTKECTASNQRAQLLRFRALTTTVVWQLAGLHLIIRKKMGNANQTVWRTIKVLLHSQSLPEDRL